MKGNHKFISCKGLNFAQDIENKTFLKMNSIQMYSSTTAQYNPCMYKIENKTAAAVSEKKKN